MSRNEWGYPYRLLVVPPVMAPAHALPSPPRAVWLELHVWPWPPTLTKPVITHIGRRAENHQPQMPGQLTELVHVLRSAALGPTLELTDENRPISWTRAIRSFRMLRQRLQQRVLGGP